MEILSHTVLFTEIRAYHRNAIENPALVIWLMSGMIVFDLHVEGINGTKIARCRSTFPRSTHSTKQSTSLRWHQKYGPRSMALMPYHTVHTQWRQMSCDRQNFPRQHNVWVARMLCCLGKFHWSHQRCFLFVYLDYTPYMGYTVRTGFSMPFQWCISFHAISTA